MRRLAAVGKRELRVAAALACGGLGGGGCAAERPVPHIAGGPLFEDVTVASGLPLMNAARLTFADLNGDGRADVVARVGDSYRVFLSSRVTVTPGVRFKEVARTGLPVPSGGDVIVFADIDNDGYADAVFARYLDVKNPTFKASTTRPVGTCWFKGYGDGTFGAARPIAGATRGTTACIAVGDANCDGLPDLMLGNWYDEYGKTNAAYPTDLLLQRRDSLGHISFERVPLPEEAHAFDEERDLGPRPIYGAMFLRLDESPFPSLLEIAYGRRWNRLYVRDEAGGYVDRAPAWGVDGDAIRHGRYPDWLKEVAKKDKRFEREDEKPFRSNGNNFDASVGDVDGDGKFDLFISAIAHAWAGESSDRSRFLLQRGEGVEKKFVYDPRLSVDRPGTSHDASTTRPNWNQGDIFCRLADVDQDGRLDLVLASSDYPDPPPHENRLRVYLQQGDGTFRDSPIGASGIDQLGAGQPSLADVNGDGTLDLLVGQSFNRFTAAMVKERTPPGPVARLFVNRAGGHSLTLRLVGNPERHVTRDAFNAIVRVTAVIGGKRVVQLRQLMGPGGHNGKGGDLAVHFGLGDAEGAERVDVLWPAPGVGNTVLRDVRAGAHVVRMP